MLKCLQITSAKYYKLRWGGELKSRNWISRDLTTRRQIKQTQCHMVEL